MKVNLKVEETTVNQALADTPVLLTPESMLVGIDVHMRADQEKDHPVLQLSWAVSMQISRNIPSAWA